MKVNIVDCIKLEFDNIEDRYIMEKILAHMNALYRVDPAKDEFNIYVEKVDWEHAHSSKKK